NLAHKGLAGLDVAETFFRNLGEGSEVLLDGPADVSDSSSVEEGTDGDRREHQEQQASELGARPDHDGEARTATEERSQTVAEILGDRLAHDDSVSAEARD